VQTIAALAIKDLRSTHPAQATISQEDYVQAIINAVKANIGSINKT